MKNIIILFTIIFSFLTGFSQQERDNALAHFKSLSAKYKSIPFLSFDIQYLYAAENTPLVHADSLKGTFALNGTRFYYSIANTRVIYEGERAITFYNDDSIIYLSKPSAAIMNNPLVILDSMSDLSEYDFSIKNLKKEILINMKSKDSTKFKEAIYEIDKESGFLSKVTQVVNAKFMYEQWEKNPGEDKISYAIITTKFSNYSRQQFDTSLFDINKYIKVVNGKYMPVQPYESYQVFNTNLNL